MGQQEVSEGRGEMVHVRRKALPRGTRQARDTYGAFDGDPQRKTLCGAPSTTQDMSWAETRFPKSRTWVTCADCISLRMSDSTGVAA